MLRKCFDVRGLLAVLTTLSFVYTPPLSAQATSGDVTGSVVDASGAAVPLVAVTAQNESTGVRTSTTTATDGTYRISNLLVGTYTLTASAKGFAQANVTNVTVQLNTTITQNLILQVTGASTTVEVTSASAAIDTTTAQIQTSYESKQILDLPTAAVSRTINGAGIWNLSLLGAGVASQGGVGQGTGPAIAGQRPENNTFNIDGVSNNNHYTTGPLVYVSNEAVAEVSLLQNQFSPEFGGASGGVFNAVVKSGSNAVHGSVFEYMQNRLLNAEDAIFATAGLTSNPRFDNNRLGATIGGPIIKDKLFYFGNFEYNPLGQSTVPGSPVFSPTATGYSMLASIPGVSKTNLGVLQKYVPAAPSNDAGTSMVNGVAIPLGSVSFNSPSYTNSYNALVSIDYNLSDKDQLRGRWIYNNSSGLQLPAQLPAFNVNSPNNNYVLTISEFHNFTPTLQNEFRSSFSRNVNDLGLPNATFPGLSQFPVITIDETGVTMGPVGPQGSIQNLFQAQDNLSKMLGRHTIKVGYHFTDVILTNYFIQRVLGNYEYSTLQQYLLDLTPDVLGERSAGPTSFPTGFLQHEAFVNDDFRVRPNFTLNLGLRYEYVTMPIASRYQIYSAPASVPGGPTFGLPKFSPNDWSPRVGFAYSPGKDGVWSIRGGFSRAFDLSYANLTSNAAPPYFLQTRDVDLSSNAPNFLANGGLPGSVVPLPADQRGALAVATNYTFGGQRPYALTWTSGVQRIFKKDYTFEARYIGTKGVHLWNQTRLNSVALVNDNNYIPTYFSMPSAATFASLGKTLGQVKSYIVPGGTADFPNNSLATYGSEGNITAYAPQAYSSYNGLALQLNKHYSNNFSYILAYTWSHMIDDATATNFSTYLTPRRAQDFQDLQADKASSALDHRQRFTFTPIYDWKPFKNHGWFLKNVVGNWNLSGTYTYETPEYATVQSGIDSNLNNDSAGDRAIINPAGSVNIGTNTTGYNALGKAVCLGSQSGSASCPNANTIVAYVANNPNARYVTAGIGAIANGGRNTFPLKPTNNIDLGIRKQFDFAEHLRFNIGAQFLNLFNHPQYTGGFINDVSLNPSSNIARNELVPSDPLFGRFDLFYTSNSRQIQVFAKFTF
jgi:Carboxypeptidase regulatory-like domain